MRTLRFPQFNVPLRLVLIIPFVVQLFAIVALVGYLSFLSGTHAVDNLASALLEKTNYLVANHLNTYLAVPQKINQLNADAVKLGLLDVEDPEKAVQYFWEEMQAYDLTYLGYGLTNGAGAGAAKYDGTTITLEEWSGDLPDNVSNYAADNQGQRAGLNEQFDFDNFKEAWYTEPIAANRPIWSRIYVWTFPGGYPYITASAGRPIYNAAGQRLGMIAADIHLLKLSDFLRDLHISPSGQIFIMERNGLLIANSGSEQPFISNGSDIERIAVEDSADARINAIAHKLKGTLGSWNEAETQDLKLRIDNELDYVSVQPWQDDYGLDWLVVTVVPEQDFMADIYASRRTTILLCLMALGMAIALGILTAQHITQPIFNLSQASQKLATVSRKRFSPDEKHCQTREPITIDLTKAGIRELDLLADSFTVMAQQLQATFIELETLNEELEARVDLRTHELQRALRDLHQTQAQMLQTEKMSALGQMVAGVAHEVNNPISFIYGNLKHTATYVEDLLGLIEQYQTHCPQHDDIDEFAETIELAFVMEDLPRVITSMQGGAERIRDIVKSLQVFSRSDESGVKRMNLQDGIDSTLMLLQHRIQRQTIDGEIEPIITIIKEFGDRLFVEGYPGQLNQAIMNILTNAIDALETHGSGRTALIATTVQSSDPHAPESPTIHIRTHREDSGWVILSIRDNGPGIPEEVRSRIFDPFFTTKPVGQGTGMGLAISHEIIVNQHQGSLSCISSPGEGTTFTIKLPCHQKTISRTQDDT